MHYKKDGSLDMRYASSRAAVSSGSNSSSGHTSQSSNRSGYSSHTPSHSSYSSYTPVTSEPLHYKKDGSLDMRYGSSRGAAQLLSNLSTPAPVSTPTPRSSLPTASAEPLHYKKDGTLDMRYSSSKLATEIAGVSLGSACGESGRSSEPLHVKKDGSLDMRYRSSREAAAAGLPVSSAAAVQHSRPEARSSTRARSSVSCLPPDVPQKADGTPDMRFRAAKEFVERQAAAQTAESGRTLPDWVPRLKDGAIDLSSAVGRAFLCARNQDLDGERRHRDLYWERRLQEEAFQRELAVQRERDVEMQPAGDLQATAALADLLETLFKPPPPQPISLSTAPTLLLPPPADALQPAFPPPVSHCIQTPPSPIPNQCDISAGSANATRIASATAHSNANVRQVQPAAAAAAVTATSNAQAAVSSSYLSSSWVHTLPAGVVRIAMDELALDAGELGRGGFGIVKRALWSKAATTTATCPNQKTGDRNGDAGAPEQVEVAVKLLHLDKFKKRGRAAGAGCSELELFVRELHVMAALGTHPNLVQLFGYFEQPPAIAMEFAALGSLTNLLYYVEDDATEAALSDGRMKRRLALGVACGMRQLHSARVVHGDLKPQNVLVTADWVAKVSDFGLASFRARTASLSSSKAMCTDEDPEESGLLAGTAAYMAPELLRAGACASYESDVYAFGILLNELVAEEEPYADQARFVVGKGPFGAAMHAAQGNRPSVRVPPNLLLDASGQQGQGNVSATPLVALIQQCWHPEARLRPTFTQCVERISADTFFMPNSEQMAGLS